VLRKIFGPRKEGKRQCRKLLNNGLHVLYPSTNIRLIKEDEMGGVCGTCGGEEICILVLITKI
jgi:hypothetical protein